MRLGQLDFEQPIEELREKITELRNLKNDEQLDVEEEIAKLELRCNSLTESIYNDLSASQIVQIARHPKRPYITDYINSIFTDFTELHGDRHISEGASIIGGIGRINNKPIVIIGQQKGRKTVEKLKRNFGMPRPEAYRKAMRLMKLGEKFHMPVLTFIDTPGAYPGIHAEEHNQSEAIARNLFVMSKLRTPIITTIIGEGGSGGALAIGTGDKILMLRYSIYSVISPEGCASILWRNAKKSEEAADALGLTAEKIYETGLIDKIVPEPLGGAHSHPDKMADKLKQVLTESLQELQSIPIDNLLEQRYKKLMEYGRFGKKL